MIVSDSHRLVFVHIPKCAGTTIKRSLAACDTSAGAFHNRMTHRDGTELDLSHLTLQQLQAYFPQTLEKVRTYDSYAIIREPWGRFASALAYYLRTVRHEQVSTGSLGDAMAEVCARLSAATKPLGHDFVYFERQSDFVQLDGKAVVRHLYPLEALHRFAADVQARHGIVINAGVRANQTRIADNPMTRAAKRIAKPLYRALPPSGRQRMRDVLHASYPASPRQVYERLFATKAFGAFVEDYYREDIQLHRSLGSEVAPPA